MSSSSQKGGLVRYRLGDRVRITGRFRNTPCIDFLGRCEATSDLVGEKLHEAFVRGVVDTLDLDEAVFVSLVPVRNPSDHYVLLVDTANRSASEIQVALEEGLMGAYHYRNARMLGQLGPARVKIASDLEANMVAYQGRRGVKWGDMKSKLLVTTPADPQLAHELR